MTAPDHATNHSKNTLRERGHPYMGFGQRKSFAHGGAINPADRPSFSVGFLVRADHAHLVGEKRRSADVDFGFKVGLETCLEDSSVSIGTGS